MLPFLVFLSGLVLGSFLNTCIYRLPRGESVISPRSHCPVCGQNLSPLDLIPLGSFLLLGGKCRYCRAPISWRYPLVELVTGLLTLTYYYRVGPRILLPALAASAVGVVAAFTDLEHGIVPDRLVLPALGTGLVFSFFSPLTTPAGSVAGVILGGGVLLVIAFLSRGGMGGGDIKLIAALGAWLGWERIILVLFLAFLLGGIGGIWLLLLKIKGRRDTMAFAPFIAGAVVLSFLAGELLRNWHFSFLSRVTGL